MKLRRTAGMVAAGAAFALVLAGCSGGGGDEGGSEGGGEGGSSIANLVNGYLGDQGFFDDAKVGIDELEAGGRTTTTLEADAADPAQWKANFESVSTGEYDIVVLGTSQMHDILVEGAPKFPDQQYIHYDDVVEAPNVASITYRQNEGSYLAGVLAALALQDTESFPKSEGSTKLGVVGGMDIPVINDFVVGFEAGAQSVDPDIEVLKSYVGDFADSSKGYDLAKSMIDDGAGVIYQVAGGAGIGALQAAADSEKYAIGVDANQNGLHEGTILASMLKHIGNSLVLAVEASEEGTLEYGGVTSYGLDNDGVGLVFEDNGDVVPQEVIDQIDEYKQQVIDGELEVPTAL